jgi:predicted PurR-regulated permease PerM
MNQFVIAYLGDRLPPAELERLRATLGMGGGAAPPASLAVLGPDTLDLIAGSESVAEDDLLIQMFIRRQAERIRAYTPELTTLLWRALVTTMLALLFSFLISLDILRLMREVQSLRASRLRDFYEQTAQPVVRFAYVVGRAIQAQAMIACANTALTLVGLLVLGVPSVAMLSLIVFVCSFIPVLGVFISTTPIVLVALNSGGFGKAAAVVGFVVFVHVVEAYVLNPLIYGKHLKLNPVVVLVILFVGHHMFGLWGMLLGVPVAYYFLHYVFGVPVWGEGRLAHSPVPLGAMGRAQSADDSLPGAAAPDESADRAE